MNQDSKIYVAGHNGLVGSAIMRQLESRGFTNLVVRTSKELDLTEQDQVRVFFSDEKPEYVILAAAKVGGIHANNTYPAEFIYQNMMIESNIIDAAYKNNVTKLLFLGSSCIYPKFSSQPMKEEYLLTGELEKTNEWYAIAKIAGIKMCQAYRKQYGFNAISLMPTNLYGPGDNFNLENSHVLPALIRRFHEAKINGLSVVEIWGTGTPRREFLHVDDLADATIFLMNHYNDAGFINVGVGEDLTINELAEIVKEVVGFVGEIKYDSTKPDGTPRKLLDVSRLKSLGWSATITIEEGVEATYKWLLDNIDQYRA